MKNIEDYLITLVEKKGSDLFISAGAEPSIKINGQLARLGDARLTSAQSQDLIFSVMTETQIEEFKRTKEYNFAISIEKLGRFRVSVYQQRSTVGAVFRRIETKIPTLDELKMPKILEEFALIQRGLIILVGATGTGKSTTLAAMIGSRNHNTLGHIVSIEDPIEYIHRHDKCIVTQREVGVDTESYEVALRNTLRQAPDVIMIGEIRSRDTMNYAITFSETGHLCLATLHANNANQALDRVAHFFPSDNLRQLWMDLSLNLRAIVAQQLIPTIDGQGRIPAVEILINTPVISEQIRAGEIDVIKEFMSKSTEQGMQTFDQSLFKLYSEGKISYESAIQYADSENEVRLMIKLSKGSKFSSALGTLSMRDD